MTEELKLVVDASKALKEIKIVGALGDLFIAVAEIGDKWSDDIPAPWDQRVKVLDIVAKIDEMGGVKSLTHPLTIVGNETQVGQFVTASPAYGVYQGEPLGEWPSNDTWGAFLEARTRCVFAMHLAGESYEQIALNLSMHDASHAERIHRHPINVEKYSFYKEPLGQPYVDPDSVSAQHPDGFKANLDKAAPLNDAMDHEPSVDLGYIKRDDALKWAVNAWHEQVANRPIVNLHRRTLDSVWRQVISFLGGDPAQMLPLEDHDTLRSRIPTAQYKLERDAYELDGQRFRAMMTIGSVTFKRDSGEALLPAELALFNLVDNLDADEAMPQDDSGDAAIFVFDKVIASGLLEDIAEEQLK